MALKVILSKTGRTATIIGGHHTIQVVGIPDAESWIGFYERLAAGPYGNFYKPKLAAFKEAKRQMLIAQEQKEIRQ